MATSWGMDAVCISYGGDAERLRSCLVTERPRRFLFTGHGDVNVGDAERTLGFTKPGGMLEAVETSLIAELLGAHGAVNDGPLELCLINGCRSAELGAAIQRAGVPCVVCWQGRVNDGAARVFARAFFQAVASGHDYARAFEEAKRAIVLATKRRGRVATPLYELRDPDAPAKPAVNDEASLCAEGSSKPNAHGASPSGRIAAGLPLFLDS